MGNFQLPITNYQFSMGMPYGELHWKLKIGNWKFEKLA